MSPKKIMIAVAAASLAATPVVAQVVSAPAIAPLNAKGSKLDNGSAVLVGILSAAAIVAGVIVAASDERNEVPISN